MTHDEIIEKLVELEQSKFKVIDIKEEFEGLLMLGNETYKKQLEEYIFKELRKRKIQKLNECNN